MEFVGWKKSRSLLAEILLLKGFTVGCSYKWSIFIYLLLLIQEEPIRLKTMLINEIIVSDIVHTSIIPGLELSI